MLYQGAWTFDPTAFHEWLEGQIVVRDELRVDRLEAIVRKLLDEPTPVAKSYMRAMRLDPDHDEDVARLFDPETEHLEEWYALAMSPHLNAAPAVSRVGMLMFTLRANDWPEVWIQMLVGGESLSSLVEACRNRWFITSFRRVAYGGWLPLTQAEALLKRLQGAPAMFSTPNEAVINWYAENQPGWSRQDLVDAMSRQYEEATSMLGTAVDRGRPLRLICDE